MMKVLFLHSDFIEVFPKVKALDIENVEQKKVKIGEALVCFISIEKTDTEEIIEDFIRELKKHAENLKIKRVVLYPFVHLSNIPAEPKKAFELIKKIEEKVKRYFEVYRAPFGWYKEFNIKVKGHPLSELSRTIKDREKIIDDIVENLKFYEKHYGLRFKIEGNSIEIITDIKREKPKEKLEKRFLILLPNGKEYLVLGEDNNKIKVVEWEEVKKHYNNLNNLSKELINFKKVEYLDRNLFNEDFKKLLDKEALGKPFEEIEKNPIREAMEKFGFEWEPLSDYGHMRYKPYAALIVDLVADYSIKIAKELPFPVYIIKGTNMFDLEKGPVAEHAKLFGERMYEVETDKSKFVLRYAACFQQFSIAKDLIISYRDLPFGMLEIADSYRFEQPGELVLGFRLRKFYMPDLHIFTKDLDEARKVFLIMHRRIMEEMKKIGRDYELLINVGSPEFYEKYKEIIFDIVKDINKPVLVCIYPPAEERYWIVNIEYHIIDILGRPREIGTTQIDIGNGRRFGIKYVDKENKENYVVILHNAILGSIERYIYALIDTALRKEKPMLPLWISPVQVRIISVSREFNEYCYRIAEEIEKNNIRVEVDDRDETVNKKIMDAEKLWIPYIIVIGKKEIEKKVLTVRVRETGEIKEYKFEELIKEIREKTEGFPFRPLYNPMSLSKKLSNL